MSNTYYAIDGTTGVNLGWSSPQPNHKPGSRIIGNAGTEWVYAQASGGAILSAGYVVALNASFLATKLLTSGAVRGTDLAVANCAFNDLDYGWFQIKGPSSVRVAPLAAANIPLNTTGTPGQLDDDAATGAYTISGLFLTAANGASAGNVAATLSFPTIATVL